MNGSKIRIIWVSSDKSYEDIRRVSKKPEVLRRYQKMNRFGKQLQEIKDEKIVKT